MQITFKYRLYDEDNQYLDEFSRPDPLQIDLDVDGFFPVVEGPLREASAGEHLEVEMGPEDAFGERDEERVVTMPRSQFEDMDIAEGQVISFVANGGEEIVGEITAMSEDFVEVDFNHPLAGKTLRCEVDVIEIEK